MGSVCGSMTLEPTWFQEMMPSMEENFKNPNTIILDQIFSSQWKAKENKTKQHKTRTTYVMSLGLLHCGHQFSISLMSGSKSTIHLSIGKRGLC